MEQITVEIDGTKVTGPKGSTILDMAKAGGIDIPTLCYDPRLQPYGACRLCLVEVEGARGLLPACYAEATDGMVVTDQDGAARADPQDARRAARLRPPDGVPGLLEVEAAASCRSSPTSTASPTTRRSRARCTSTSSSRRTRS